MSVGLNPKIQTERVERAKKKRIEKWIDLYRFVWFCRRRGYTGFSRQNYNIYNENMLEKEAYLRS